MGDILKAVRGVQRNAEITVAKLEDTTAGLATVQSKVDMALPKLFHLLDQLLAGSTDATSSDGSHPRDLAALRELLGGENGPGHFASQKSHDSLRHAVEALGGEVRGQLGALHRELFDALQGKADRDDVQHLHRKQQELSNMV